MSREEAMAAIDVGLDTASQLAEEGVRLIGLGEMGIGNTTAASAVIAAVTGLSAAEVTGRGTALTTQRGGTRSLSSSAASRSTAWTRPIPSACWLRLAASRL
jgi:nicotinate-nucleotide--dimethylbenzimidazole phosphoribosyltransferase